MSNTKAIDLATIMRALQELERTHPHAVGGEWIPRTPEQARFLQQFDYYGEEVDVLDHLVTLASTSPAQLNAFLQQHRFSPVFDESAEGEWLGAVAILDLLLKWVEPGTDAVISRPEKNYPAFRLRRSSGFTAYEHPDLDEPLVQIETPTGSLWLHKGGVGLGELELFNFAADLTASPSLSRCLLTAEMSELVVPCLDIALQPDISFLLGLYTSADWVVTEAIQQLRVRANKYGARAEVATAVGMRVISLPTVYTFDEPFMLWFTQPRSSVPLAVVFADTDVWEDPGTLGEEHEGVWLKEPDSAAFRPLSRSSRLKGNQP